MFVRHWARRAPGDRTVIRVTASDLAVVLRFFVTVTDAHPDCISVFALPLHDAPPMLTSFQATVLVGFVGRYGQSPTAGDRFNGVVNKAEFTRDGAPADEAIFRVAHVPLAEWQARNARHALWTCIKVSDIVPRFNPLALLERRPALFHDLSGPQLLAARDAECMELREECAGQLHALDALRVERDQLRTQLATQRAECDRLRGRVVEPTRAAPPPAKRTLPDVDEALAVVLATPVASLPHLAAVHEQLLRLCDAIAEERRRANSDAPTCAVCLDATPQLMYMPCGHVCTCVTCDARLSRQPEYKCPQCQGLVAGTHRAYW